MCRSISMSAKQDEDYITSIHGWDRRLQVLRNAFELFAAGAIIVVITSWIDPCS